VPEVRAEERTDEGFRDRWFGSFNGDFAVGPDAASVHFFSGSHVKIFLSFTFFTTPNESIQV
jgi:hypothetical protein